MGGKETVRVDESLCHKDFFFMTHSYLFYHAFFREIVISGTHFPGKI